MVDRAQLLNATQSKIDETKAEWLPKLKDVVDKMGRTFAERCHSHTSLIS